MKAPDWLVEFPFLDKNWPEVSSLLQSCPTLNQFDLLSDWQNFLKQQSGQATTDWFKTLRLYRQSRLAYVVFCDLNTLLSEHVETMRLVSSLADHLIAVAYEVAQSAMAQRYGVVIDAQGKPVELLVFGLGKLGTHELNYSSDVDLVFLYENEGQSNGQRILDAADYFIRMGQKIIKLLDLFTSDGQVYRVDMRLRPFGSAGPLACSLAALQNYLLHEGRDWERFAWMRARVICGQSDANVMAVLRPFIYRRHLDYQVFDALAEIKSEMAKHSEVAAEHMKLGHGGIRNIEFIVQSLQLVFGGRNEQLQGTAIYPQFNHLLNANKLKANEAGALCQTWLLLRKIENLVQAVDDQSNHSYPENPVVQQVISEAVQFQNWQHVHVHLEDLRNQVGQIFSDLFKADSKQQTTDQQRATVDDMLNQLPLSRMPHDRVEQIKQLFSAAVVITEAKAVLNRFVELVKTIVTRPAYVLMLLRESNLLTTVLELLDQDVYFANALKRHPVLLEQLFEFQPFVIFDQNSLQQQWAAQKKDPADPESWLEALRHFKNYQQFNLMLAYANHAVNAHQACQQLSLLARFILQEVIAYSYQELMAKFSDSCLMQDDLIVIAYGSAATDEMHIDSDLDLVFVLDLLELNNHDRTFAQKWLKRIAHHLNSPMYNGRLYELDMQLRPNGNSGTLITTCAEFSRYQHQQAWIWEHAAMIKSKAIIGTEAQLKWHDALRVEVLKQKREPQTVDMALDEMAQKLPVNEGEKNHQHEFEILGLVLKHANQFPHLLQHHSLSNLYEQLLALDLLTSVKDSLQKKGPLG